LASQLAQKTTGRHAKGRKERWVAMMKVLERNDITAWRKRFVRALSAIDTQR
jgi:trehalose-6-phosphate synthase